MKTLDTLKTEIETERRILDQMLESMSMEEVLGQSRKLDQLVEEYICMTN